MPTQVARIPDGQRVVVLDVITVGPTPFNVITRPWRWWSPLDLVRLAKWARHARRYY